MAPINKFKIASLLKRPTQMLHTSVSPLPSNSNSYGENPLHLACTQTPTLSTIQTLLQTHPEYASRSNQFGHTPLHYVCHPHTNGCIQVVRLLLQCYPAAIHLKDHMGRLPLHHACMCGSGNSFEILSCLIEAYPGGIVEVDESGATPLRLLWMYYSESKKGRREVSCTKRLGRLVCGMVGIWNKMSLSVLSAYYGRVVRMDGHGGLVESDGWYVHPRLLHACARIGEKCPVSFAELVMLLYPSQLREKDEQSNLPLHIALARPNPLSQPKLPPLGDRTSETNAGLIRTLVHHYPDSAKIADNANVLPIFCALEMGLTWRECIKDIVWAAPETVDAVDRKTCLYPFMLAGVTSSAETVFELLRVRPEAVQVGIPHRGDTWKLDP